MNNYLIAYPGKKPEISADTHLVDALGVCKFCGHAGELVYHQYQINDASCQWCGEWQNEKDEAATAPHKDPLKAIDWDLLRRQKAWLLQFDSAEAEGLLNLIDGLQDHAVDTLFATEEQVFGKLSGGVTQ